MIGFLPLLTIALSLFQLTGSIPGLIPRDRLPPTRISTQDISDGALGGDLLPVPGGLHTRRLLWFWGSDEEETDISKSTTVAPYDDGVTTTKQPSRWSRWKSKVKNAFKELGNDIKEAANATKWAMKKAGRKVKEGFKKGYKKIKMKIMSVDDKLNHFANRLKVQAEKGNEKAIRLLQKLGIIAHVEDGKVVGVDVEDEIDSIDNILKEEGALKMTSTAKPARDNTKPISSTDNVNNNSFTTPSKTITSADNMSTLHPTNLPNITTSLERTTTHPSKGTTETIKATIKISTAEPTTTEPTKPTLAKVTSSTVIPFSTRGVIKSTTEVTTAQPTTEEQPKITTKASKTTTEIPKTTSEPSKSTMKTPSIEQPFKTDSPPILENADDKDAPVDDKDAYIDNSLGDGDEDEEIYSPPPFPDVFGDSRVKDRLMELYEKGDFTHSELADLFDPDYYEYYYDYD